LTAFQENPSICAPAKNNVFRRPESEKNGGTLAGKMGSNLSREDIVD